MPRVLIYIRARFFDVRAARALAKYNRLKARAAELFAMLERRP